MPRFKANQFTATECTTAEEKARFANHFVRFLLSGFHRKKFTKWFYTRLSMTFGHIANHDQNGFYETWFSTIEKQRQFIWRLRNHTAYGDPNFTFVDVERLLVDWAKNDGRRAIDEVLNQNAEAQQQAITAEHERLAALQKQSCQKFKVAAVSQNVGGFGHRQYVVVAEDGAVFLINIIPSNLSLSEGQVIDVPLCNGQLKWDDFHVEIPTRLPNAPSPLIQAVWDE